MRKVKTVFLFSVSALSAALTAFGFQSVPSLRRTVLAQEPPKQVEQQPLPLQATAQPQPPAAPAAAVPPNPPEAYAGLWREGKAVFSDVPLLDIVMLLRSAEFVRGYQPVQPIRYSHKVHVEQYGMECQYCHFGVAKSPFAGIPSVELCMGCHKVIKTVNGQESPEVKKLAEFFEKGQQIEWKPVSNLPEVSRFNHERHLKAGVGCHSYHGQVQKMEVVERVSSFKMGFCVSCHRERGASIDCAVCHY